MMVDLFPETIPAIDTNQDGAVWWIGHYECRNFGGFLQSREEGRGPWLFSVQGFSGGSPGEETIAHVVLANRSRAVPCPIDSKGRIRIAGILCDRNTWNH